MHESDRHTEQALQAAETARGKLMNGDRAGAAEALTAGIERAAEALRLLGYEVSVSIAETEA